MNSSYEFLLWLPRARAQLQRPEHHPKHAMALPLLSEQRDRLSPGSGIVPGQEGQHGHSRDAHRSCPE